MLSTSNLPEMDYSAIISELPTLALCAVVDSRFSSRSKILRELKASNLFQNVVEAKSIEHAKSMLQEEQLDAVILGPSVSI